MKLRCWWRQPNDKCNARNWAWSSVIIRGWAGGEAAEGGDVCILIDDPHCPTAETSTSL